MKKILATLALALALPVIGATTAHAEPFGGCREGMRYPSSAGAQDCREAGWTVRPRILVNPQGWVVATTLKRCALEDSRNCTWRAGQVGNREGHSFYDIKGRTFYVKGYLR